MAGLDPAIHVFVTVERKQDVDARHKAGHDDVKNRLSAHQTFKQPHLRVLATNFARVLSRLLSLKTRGSRECRAFGSPAASCAKVESTRVSHHRSAATIRHSLRDGFTTYSALSPAIGLFCHRRQR
jgi:hypothetical protein